MDQIDAPIGGRLVVMRREERPRILVDSPSQYNHTRSNCEEVTVKAKPRIGASIDSVTG